MLKKKISVVVIKFFNMHKNIQTYILNFKNFSNCLLQYTIVYTHRKKTNEKNICLEIV